MIRRARTMARGEEGMTLPEIMTAILLGTIVMLGAYAALDTFTRNAAHHTRVTDANDQVRRTMDDTVRHLRGASVILRAQSADLVYAVPATATSTDIHRVCVDAGVLHGDVTTGSVPPVVPGTNCAALPRVATLDSGTSTAFSYDGAASSPTPSTVKNVGLTISLRATTGSRTSSSTLRASAARRSAQPLPLDPSDLPTPPCTSEGGGILDLAADVPGLSTLTVTYTDQNGNQIPGSQVGSKLTVGAGGFNSVNQVVATIVDPLGLSTVLRRNITCANT